jgi:YesN/AraC family two-component response regulator
MSEAKNTYVILKNNPDLKKLELKPDAPIGGEQLIKTYLEQFLIILIRDILNKNAPPLFPYKENTESKLVSEIKEYMKSKISEKLTAKDICNHFGYSKTHLSTLFKTQCSTSLMQYFNILKIEYSKKLLRENQYNITQISNALSFDNPQYFSRVFKRVTGLTPSEFINTLEFNN